MSTLVQHKRNFFDFFPLPRYLEMPSVGIDISDQAIRFVEIVHYESGHHQFHLRSYGEKKIPEGVISGGSINKPEEVKKILAEIRKEHGYKFICVSLPEEKGYLFKTELPDVEQKYFAENIEMHLEENVPIDAKKAVFDFNLINSNNPARHAEAVVTVVPNKVIDVYSDLFQSTSFIPVSYELITQAVARAVVPYEEYETCLIVYVGETRTGFGIVSDGALQFTSTVNVEHVVDPAGVERKCSMLKDEVVKLVLYWQGRSQKDNAKIKRLILSGRESTIAGLKECLAEAAICRVESADVWVNIFNIRNQIPEMSFEDSLDYAPAIGLALSRYHHA